jgi:hypothetical protein
MLLGAKREAKARQLRCVSRRSGADVDFTMGHGRYLCSVSGSCNVIARPLPVALLIPYHSVAQSLETSMRWLRPGFLVSVFAAATSIAAIHDVCRAQASDTNIVVPITPPRTALPPEDATRNITKFSFIAYGDTRGAFDGTIVQYEHSLVMATMLRKR